MRDEEINQVFRFRDFPVYRDARNYRKKLKSYSKKYFPQEAQYNLTSQLWRALDSIVLNIAEGTDRFTKRSHSTFINYSIGSLDEVCSCIDCAFDDEYINRDTQLKWIKEGVHIMKQLRALSASLRRGCNT